MENYDSIFAPKEAAQNKTFSPIDKQAWAEKKQAEQKFVTPMTDGLPGRAEKPKHI